MRMRTPALVAGLLIALVASCGDGPESGTVGIAIRHDHRHVVAIDLARETLARDRRDGELAIEFSLSPVAQAAPGEIDVLRAETLVSNSEIVAVLGPSHSRGALVAAPIYNAAGVPHIPTISTSRLLRDAGPWTFMLAPDDSAEGTFMAAFAAGELGATSAAVFYENDEYGVGLLEGIVSELRRRGVVVTDRVPYTASSDIEALVAASWQRHPMAVLLVAGRNEEVSRVARQAHAIRPGLPVVASDAAMAFPDVVDSAGPGANSLYITCLWSEESPDSLSRDFSRRFREFAGRAPEPFDAFTYDAAMVLGAAIRAAGADRAAVAAWLRSLGESRPLYQGVTGQIGFGVRAMPHFRMVRIVDGRPVPVTGS